MKKKLTMLLIGTSLLLSGCGNDNRSWDELTAEEQIEQLEILASNSNKDTNEQQALSETEKTETTELTPKNQLEPSKNLIEDDIERILNLLSTDFDFIGEASFDGEDTFTLTNFDSVGEMLLIMIDPDIAPNFVNTFRNISSQMAENGNDWYLKFNTSLELDSELEGYYIVAKNGEIIYLCDTVEYSL